MPGPRNRPPAALPNVPFAGRAHTDVLKKRSNVFWLFDSLGSPVTTMRAPTADPVMSAPSLTLNDGVKGEPLTSVVMPLSCQLSATIPSALDLNLSPSLGRS